MGAGKYPTPDGRRVGIYGYKYSSICINSYICIAQNRTKITKLVIIDEKVGPNTSI